MSLNKPAKIIIGVLTFIPLLVVLGSFIFVIYEIMTVLASEEPFMPLLLMTYLSYVIPYMFIYFIFYLGLGIFYLVHIIQNISLDTEKRFLWIVVLVILSWITMPIYWIVHIWKDDNQLKSDQLLKQTHEPART